MNWYYFDPAMFDSQIISLVNREGWSYYEAFLHRHMTTEAMPRLSFEWETGEVLRDFVRCNGYAGVTLVSEKARQVLSSECKGFCFEPVSLVKDGQKLDYYFLRTPHRFKRLCFNSWDGEGKYVALRDPVLEGADPDVSDVYVGPAHREDEFLVSLVVSERLVKVVKANKLKGARIYEIGVDLDQCHRDDIWKYRCEP